ncbi:Leukotoxin translocation ATP-binding protein LktB, partial [Durusdinium trenchii]
DGNVDVGEVKETGKPPMIASPNEGSLARVDLEAASWLFEQLGVDVGRPADRARIRRALDEALAVWQSASGERWWKWLVEAGISLDMHCKVVDCTFDELVTLARDGARLVTCVGDNNAWHAISGTRGRRFRVLRPLRDPNRRWVGRRKLRQMFDLGTGEDYIRCVVFDRQPLDAGDAELEPRTMSPIDRLLALLRPEAGDLWIIVIFALVTGILALASPLAVETLVNTVAFGRLLQPVVILALMLLAFLSFSAALRALQTYVVEIIQQRLFARVAADLAYRLPRAEVEAIDGHHGRELVNRFFDVVTIQKVSAQLLLDGVSLIVGALIGMAVLAFYHPWLLGFDFVLLAMIGFVIFVLGRGAVQSAIKESKSKYRMAAWLEDLIGSPTAFRHSGAAEFALDRADRLTYEYLKARRAHFRILMRQIVFALAMQAIASTVLLGLGGWLVISGQLTLGQLVASELIVTVIVGSFAKLGKHMESYYDLLAAVDKLGYLFDLPMERRDGLLLLPKGQAAHLKVVQVSYDAPHGGSLLNGMSLEVERGERLMLTGPSGQGKSQLLDLLFGTRTPDGGHITLDGFDPRDVRPDALRRHVALVRDIEVFEGSIAQNVHLERPEISTNDVREALDAVGLLEDVLQLPEGLETQLIPTGWPLTPNQSRKLMLARAIVGQPRLLLIDGIVDCLSDADAERVTRMLVHPDQPWTLIMVTGREPIAAAGSRRLDLGRGMGPRVGGSAHVH